MTLLGLPVEVLSQVIERLGLKGILHCRQVCQLLRKLVDSSVSIQYTIELLASGALDGPLPLPSTSNTTFSKAHRLSTLRSLNTAWKHLHHPPNSFSIPNVNWPTAYELSRGLFIQDVNENWWVAWQGRPHSTLSWLDLPSSLHGVVRAVEADGSNAEGEEPRWMTHDFDFRVDGFCLDVERDLIVLVERRAREWTLPHDSLSYTITCVLHLLSLTTFTHHPDAAQPTISASFEYGVNDYTTVITLGGDHVALLLSTNIRDTECTNWFFLWDWTSGVRKDSDVVCEKGVIPQWDTVCFISHSALLLPDTLGSVLDIYTFTDEPGSLVRAVSLHLPLQSQIARLMSITARSEPAPSSPHVCRLDGSHANAPRTYQRRPFTTDPESAIVVITMQYSTDENLPEPEQTLVAHRSTLLELARRDSRFVTSRPTHVDTCQTLYWEEWGPLCARWGLSATPRWVCYTYGQRFVSMGPVPVRRLEDENGEVSRPLNSITVYDFNVMNAERDIPTDNSHTRTDFFPHKRPTPPPSPMRSEDPHMRSDTPNTHVDMRKSSGNIGQSESDSGSRSFISRNTAFGDHVSEVQNVTTKSVISRSRIFESDIVSSLPYRVVSTHAVFDWDSVMIDDERIIGVKEGEMMFGLESLEVLVI
ncbi:hypothetical protein BD410DRAFT_832321 [Rickenella mellea]|uniref:F-box domain-containing protein n=1 Tax=Rickenella mellea TaxID=50990 RepID=A0A4Y7PLK0_9AGAM|nr:hypothetical protein BD410DRAFT_832321 [Rickenella mellea]